MNDGRFYVGQTAELQNRFKAHSKGFGSETTRFFGKEKCVYVEKQPDRISALTREKQLKKWSRAKKIALAKGDFSLLKRLAKKRS